MTPYELTLFVDAHNERMKQKTEQMEMEQELHLTYAWLTAYWHRVKKMPSLKEILKKEPAKKKMTNEEMLNEVKKLNAAFGGTVY